MKRNAPPICFAGSQLGEVRHVCAFFSSDDEEYRVLLPFIKEGFERGDKAVHVVNPDEFLAEVQQRRSIPQSHRRGDLTDRGFGA